MPNTCDPEELLELNGTGERWGVGCTWSSLADLYYKVHQRRQAGEPPEHIAGALDISKAQVGRIGVRMAQWFAGNSNPGPGMAFGQRPDPIEHLAAIAALLDAPTCSGGVEDLALVRRHVAEAKRQGLDWERIYRVATTARPEAAPPPSLDAVRPPSPRRSSRKQRKNR